MNQQNTFFDEKKQQLHLLIKKHDLSGLKQYVDKLQMSLISFDDPSLLLLAIEIYLQPTKLFADKEIQREMIIFLSKCGLKFYVPGGTFILKIYDYWRPDIHTAQEFNDDLHLLFDQILKEGKMELLKNIIPRVELPHQPNAFIREECQHHHHNCPLHQHEECPFLFLDPEKLPNHPINPFSHSFQRVETILIENYSALKIQSLWRGYSIRKNLHEKTKN